MPELPSGTVTFLFTDLEGSTRLWEERADAMRVALAGHDEILRAAIAQHDGHVVKTTGDGFHAAFAIAADAVRAALDAQLVLAGMSWPEVGSLRVRMGLHTGVADVRDGDYFGSALNRAARLMSVAHGGQVVVSQVTDDLVHDFLPPGVESIDLGEHRLRDLTSPIRVFQITHPDLERDFPPLRSLDAYAGNLPLQLTSFVGREVELISLTDALTESRMVTIVGVGGVGKTRIALQLAATLISEYHDGAWVCELATATDAESVAKVVGGALGMTLQSGVTVEASIVEFLRDRQVLLVFDNCEHVLDAAGRLAESVLRACGAVRVLATSREPLALGGERIVALRSLAVADATDTIDTIAASEAVRLFEDRARAARSGFVVDASNAGAVGEICRRLDGIPLAIELAAARVVAMSPNEIAALLDERFRLLTGGRRGTLERHQTLRATVEWSYALLEPTERIVFNRLAVFSGLDANAARGVVAGDDLDDWSVIDALEGLVRKSMLNAEEQPDASTRYQMLETLRQYALEQLDGTDELDTWRRRHATYFAEFTETVGPGLLGPDEFTARSSIDADLDNLRTASIWALDRDTDDAELGVRILAALVEDYAVVDRTRWALPSPERAIAAARRSTPGRRAAVLAGAAYEAGGRNDFETADALGREAFGDGIPLDCPTPYRVCAAVTVHGRISQPAAIPLLEDVVAQLETTNIPPAELARIVLLLVGANVMREDFEAARLWAERADQEARKSANSSTIAQAAYYRGQLWARDEPARAITAYRQCIEMCRLGAEHASLEAALFQCALLLARSGERQAALTDLRESIERSERMNQRPVLWGALGYTIEILTELGAYEDAAVIAGAARSGALTHLKDMTPPPERRQRNAGPLRDALGDQFHQHAALGAAMTFDELVTWTIASLTRLLKAT